MNFPLNSRVSIKYVRKNRVRVLDDANPTKKTNTSRAWRDDVDARVKEETLACDIGGCVFRDFF